MKKLITIIAALTVAASAAYAGCGKIETTKGKLESFDSESKSITVKGTDGKAVKLTLTPSVKGDIKSLVGKTVTVTSEHKKVSAVVAS